MNNSAILRDRVRLLFAAVGLIPAIANCQTTNIDIGAQVVQPSVKRLGMNMGQPNYYDSDQMMKNLIFINPGFEGEIYRSTIRCATGTATSCTDENQYTSWPAGFWNGATYQIFWGTSAGRSGTVVSSTGPSGSYGVTLNFGDSGTAPAAGDYLIVSMKVPGNGTAGWWTSTSGNGTITTESSDLSPTTPGTQAVQLNAPTASDSASLTSYFDSMAGISFTRLNGTYQLSFLAKGTGGANTVNVQVFRYSTPGETFISQPVTLTNSWATYTLNFTASETNSVGIAGVTFMTTGADSFYLDDVSLVQTNGSPSNPTAFRDPVVNALLSLQPGSLRFWAYQLGDSLDNMLASQFARQRAGYSSYGTVQNQLNYGLYDFLQLCQLVGAEPWIVVPPTFSTTEASELIDYLAGSTLTTYGAKRAAQGQSAPWTNSFNKIHLEFGNEAWNSTFMGGVILYSQPYGNRTQTIFGTMRSNTNYVASKFDLILGGQAVWMARNNDIQNNCNNNDSFSVAPYQMGEVDTYDNNQDLFGPTFAEPEALVSATGVGENVTGMMYQNQLQIQASSHPVPLVIYEVNMGTTQGAIPESVLSSYATSVGAGLAVADNMLMEMKTLGITTQNLWQLGQYEFEGSNGELVNLWGAVVDMGVTDRRRPQFLALQLANQAIPTGGSLLQTTHTGANPTWNQPLVNGVQMNGAHYLQSYAFSQGTNRSVVIFNFNLTTALGVTFSDVNAPSGTVQMQQLTSTNVTDTNEVSNVVATTSQQLTNFNPASVLSLPPFSMTVLTWQASAAAPPVISSVTASGITTTSATITWTTDQASSSQVDYGTTASYGSASPANSSLVTSHSVSLTGLTAGTTYDYAAVSANSVGASTTSANFTFSTTAAPAPVISSVTATGISTTSATITWTTDQASSSQVKYGTSASYGTASSVNGSLVTSHSVTLTGLTAGTTYDYAAVSANSAGTSTTSANFTFSTTAAPAPVVSSVAATSISTTSATITWTTDQASSSQVKYGTTASYGSTSSLSSSLVTSHSLTLTGLTPGTTYDYAAVSANSAGASTTSGNFTFATTAVAPVISSVTVASFSTTSATITWTTDQPSSSQVKYGTTTSYGSTSSLNSSLVTSHSVTLTGLTQGTTYDYAAVSANSAGLSTTSGNYTFFTTAAGPVISSLAAPNIGTTGATITWTTDQPSSSQVKYGLTTAYGSASSSVVMAASVSNSMVTSHSVTLTGLTAGTLYNCAAVSTNAAGITTTSANYTFTTTPAASSQGPAPQISNVAYWGITGSGIQISWSTDIVATSAVQYGTTSAALTSVTPVQTTLSNNHYVVLSGLASGTTYYFEVTSVGANGGVGYSTVYSFTTQHVTPPTVSNIQPVPEANNQATISWTSSEPATNQVEYGSTTSYGIWGGVSGLTQNPTAVLTWVPSGTVHYRIHSTDNYGNETTTPDYTFIEP